MADIHFEYILVFLCIVYFLKKNKNKIIGFEFQFVVTIMDIND